MVFEQKKTGVTASSHVCFVPWEDAVTPVSRGQKSQFFPIKKVNFSDQKSEFFPIKKWGFSDQKSGIFTIKKVGFLRSKNEFFSYQNSGLGPAWPETGLGAAGAGPEN